ncbi:hypothetical protein RRF57_004394 [Xylaria bambusicola]|uniref:Uncharacterized protein n=1 Tax=Xylaria bambusicola TaxID=326684 RepID=A0AAN7UN05_9PEZI
MLPRRSDKTALRDGTTCQTSQYLDERPASVDCPLRWAGLARRWADGGQGAIDGAIGWALEGRGT